MEIGSAQQGLFGERAVNINYDGRPTITFDIPLSGLFEDLEITRNGFRADMQNFLEEGNYPFKDESANLYPGLALSLSGQANGVVSIAISGYGGNMSAKVKGCVSISAPKIRADWDRLVLRSSYSLATDLSAWQTQLVGLDVEIKKGVSLCSVLVGLLDIMWEGDLTEFVEQSVENLIEDHVQHELETILELDGIGSDFLGLVPLLQAIPSGVFAQANLTRQQVIDVLTDPFDGIELDVSFDERDGYDDELDIYIDVPWEHRPVASFSATPQSNSTVVYFNASGSYDPDGGSVSYQWNFGDGHTVSTSNPSFLYGYEQPGFYTIRLTVTDDEMVTRTTIRQVNLSGQSCLKDCPTLPMPM